MTIAIPGDYGKPRPALVIQADPFNKHASVSVLSVTSTLIDAPLLRIPIEPDDGNGLQKPSQVKVDKAMTVKWDKVGPPFGPVEENTMIEVERSLAVFIGIAE